MAAGPTTEDLVNAQMELFKDCENPALLDRFKEHLVKSYTDMNPPVAAKEEIMESLNELKKLRHERKPTPGDVPEDPLRFENVRKKLLEVYMKLELPENKDMLQSLNKSINENMTDDAKTVLGGVEDARQDFFQRHNLHQAHSD